MPNKYVYLIHSPEENRYKIGVSIHPNKRMSELQTGNSVEFKMIHMFLTEHANVIEKAMHRKYSYLRKNGEWFNLDLSDELNFIENCKRFESNIICLKKMDNVFI